MSDPFHELTMPAASTAGAANAAEAAGSGAPSGGDTLEGETTGELNGALGARGADTEDPRTDGTIRRSSAASEHAASDGTAGSAESAHQRLHLHRKHQAGPAGEAGLEGGTGRRRTLLRRIAGLAITGGALYVVTPTILSVLHSFPQLRNVTPYWFPVLFVLQVACFGGTWILVRFALRTRRWFPVITSQLAGNAVSRVLPGGVAAGPALQAAMLARSGYPGVLTATAMSSTGLLLTGTLLLLPLLAVPALLFGLSLPRALQFGLALSLILAVLIAAIGILLLRTDVVLRKAAHATSWVQRTIRKRPSDPHALATRLLHERDEVRSSFARNPYRALTIAAITRLLDYATLVVALLAVGVNTSPTLVLLAFVGSAALSMVPITPGGVGFVEAGLTGLLALAGVPANEALVGTLLYRLTSYWLPLPVGLIAYVLWHNRAEKDRERNLEPPEAVEPQRG